jgi:hypothetical protein
MLTVRKHGYPKTIPPHQRRILADIDLLNGKVLSEERANRGSEQFAQMAPGPAIQL